MSVRYRGVTHRIQYTPGPDGLDSFVQTLQSIGIKVASASQVTFLCRSPDTGEEVALRGLKAFDAAAYCASITAAKRMVHHSSRRRSSSGDDTIVHATHPDSPTAAGGSGRPAQRCEEPGQAAAASAAAAEGEPAPRWPRTVAHVHAEALQDADAAPDTAAAAAAATPLPPRIGSGSRSGSGARLASAPQLPHRSPSSGARQRRWRDHLAHSQEPAPVHAEANAHGHGHFWHAVVSLASLVLGTRRHE